MPKQIEPLLFRFWGWNTQGDFGPYTFYTDRFKRLTFFLKAPPLEPPTALQVRQRSKFTLAAAAWRSYLQPQRDAWERAAKRAKLRITGYNLFVYFQTTGDQNAIHTVERLSGVTLLPQPTI